MNSCNIYSMALLCYNSDDIQRSELAKRDESIKNLTEKLNHECAVRVQTQEERDAIQHQLTSAEEDLENHRVEVSERGKEEGKEGGGRARRARGRAGGREEDLCLGELHGILNYCASSSKFSAILISAAEVLSEIFFCIQLL